MIVLNVYFLTCGLSWYHEIRPCHTKKYKKYKETQRTTKKYKETQRNIKKYKEIQRNIRKYK